MARPDCATRVGRVTTTIALDLGGGRDRASVQASSGRPGDVGQELVMTGHPR